MAANRQEFPSTNRTEDLDWIQEKLVSISRNLLERPHLRRGPFVITDNDLQDKVESLVRR